MAVDGSTSDIATYAREVAHGRELPGDIAEFAIHGRAALAVDRVGDTALVVIARHPQPDESIDVALDAPAGGLMSIEEVLLQGPEYSSYAGGGGTIEPGTFDALTGTRQDQDWPAAHIGSGTAFPRGGGQPITYSTLRVHRQIEQLTVNGRNITIHPGGWAAILGDTSSVELIDQSGQPQQM